MCQRDPAGTQAALGSMGLPKAFRDGNPDRGSADPDTIYPVQPLCSRHCNGTLGKRHAGVGLCRAPAAKRHHSRSKILPYAELAMAQPLGCFVLFALYLAAALLHTTGDFRSAPPLVDVFSRLVAGSPGCRNCFILRTGTAGVETPRALQENMTSGCGGWLVPAVERGLHTFAIDFALC